MPYEFKFPDVGEGITEGEVVKWLVKVGDKVKNDQPLGEVETDKAVVEMPSPKAGKILKLHHKEGETVQVGEVIVTILEEGESEEEGKAHLENAGKGKPKEGKEPYTDSIVGFLEEAKEVMPTPNQKVSAGQASGSSTSIKAAPAVRMLAKKLGIDLTTVKGTGPNGAITLKDVESAQSGSDLKTAPQTKPTTDNFSAYGEVDRQPLKGVRKKMAEKMAESIFTAAQVTNTHEANVKKLDEFRKQEKEKYAKENVKITFMPYIVKAVALSLKDHPYLNASLDNGDVVFKKYYNVGVAVDTEHGLFVPVVKGAAAKDIKTLATDIEKLAEDCKTRKVNPTDLKGGTFTISNLGAVGLEFFTPIINYPESAILGVGRIVERPVVEDGKVVIRKVLPLSLTYDHRIVDGAQAARFANDVIKRLEECKFD